MKHIWTNPYVAGIANGLLPGLGYLLIDERKVFGWLLLVGSIICMVLSFVEPAFLEKSFFISTTILGQALELSWYALFIAAYAYDAFSLARAKQLEIHPAIIS